ncbi:MAG: ABC transporter ATP-binding protein [Gammaproteobacteria bacterium]|nr:MAG: ABC transporter ATP-binding protein [Gammaproteobacteria bacterium]
MYIIKIIRNIFKLLSKEQRSKMLLLQIFFVFSAVVQVVGVASIAPFIGIISNPETIHSNTFLKLLHDFLGAESDQQFIIIFAVLSVSMIFFSNAVSALTLWLLLKFSISIGSELQYKLYSSFLNREYLFHKSTNYTQQISAISQEAPRFVYMVLQPYLLLCSNAFIAIIILLGLLFLSPLIALASAFIIGGAYTITYWLIKKSLVRHGKILTEKYEALQSILSESFIGIKDIKLNTLENKYSNVYKTTNFSGLNSSAFIVLAGDIPKFAIEAISFGAILVFAIILLLAKGNDGSVVAILSIYAIAGYKLLPTMQQIYKSAASMSANGGVAAELKEQLHEYVVKADELNVQPLQTIKKIELAAISYKYPTATETVLNGINVEFNKGQLNTIAGPSGSGKSTLADIMLGLLQPISGDINIDGERLTKNTLTNYQHSIGYVPQHIFILDDTVIGNVAFGVEIENIDIEKVKRALVQANAMEFVEKLPLKLNTNLGQDGKLLSGGQRQRIGIARALYRDNKVLILDEPTSALDIESEFELMSLLGKLKYDVLTVVISHRPAAIKLSDKICILESGQMLAQGSYSELMRSNRHFQELMEKGFMG